MSLNINQLAVFRISSTLLLVLLFSSLSFAQRKSIPFKHLNVLDGMSEASATAMVQDPQGFIWIGSQNGLMKYDGYGFKTFLPKGEDVTSGKYPVMHAIHHLELDKDGKIWVGSSWGGGLACLNPVTEHFTNYFTEVQDSLTDFLTHIYFVHPDSRGDVWIATGKSSTSQEFILQRLNRQTNQFHKYNLPIATIVQSRGLPPQFQIKSKGMAEDASGNIWLSTVKDGVYQYRPSLDSFQLVLHKDSIGFPALLSDTLTSIRIDEDQRLWIAGNKGLEIYNTTQKTLTNYPYTTPSDATKRQVYNSYQDQKGNIWVGVEEGPCRFNLAKGTYQHLADFNSEKELIVLPILEDKEGVWFTKWFFRRGIRKTENTFAYYHQATDSVYIYDNQFNDKDNTAFHSVINSALIDQSGLMWIGSRWGGINKEDPAAKRITIYQHHPENEGTLPADTINYLLEDHLEQIWVGTPKGLAKYNSLMDDFEVFLPNPKQLNNKQNNITKLYEDQQNQLWVGTLDGLFLFDSKTKKFQLLHKSKKIPNNTFRFDYGAVLQILETKDGNIWVSFRGEGVYVFNPTSQKSINSYFSNPEDSTSLVSNEILFLLQDARENMWLASYSKGVSRLDVGANSFINYKPDYKSFKTTISYFTCFMEEDAKGDIWFGSNGVGVVRYRYADDSMNQIHQINNLSVVNGMIVDKRGRLWFPAFLMGLNLYEPDQDKWSVFTEEEGLMFNDLSAVSIIHGQIPLDKNDNLWIPNERGILSFNTETFEVNNYWPNDGFQTSKRYSNVLLRKNGEIWVGGNNGLNRVNPTTLKIKSPPPQIHLMAVNEGEKGANLLIDDFKKQELLELNHQQNDLTLSFTGLHYLYTEDNQYSYLLEGFDKNWSTPAKERKVRYTALPPGDYTFRVKASNSEDIWNEAGTSLRIHIAPPWWKTWWAYLSYLALLGFGIFAYTNWRTKRLRSQRLALEEKVKERTEEIGKRVEELQVVNQISQAAASELEFDALVTLVGEEMRKTFAADLAYIAIKEPNQSMIQFPYQYGETLAPLRFGEGLTSKIIKTGQPLLINQDVKGTYEKYGLKERGTVPDSYLGVPIKVGNTNIGVLSVQKTSVNQSFSQEDQRLLKTIAANVGVAIRNAQLYREAQLAKANAEEANNAKSSFLSTVSHELRTPLTSVLGFAKIIKKRLEDRIFPQVNSEDKKVQKSIGQVSKNLNVVISEGERLTQLINDVLDLAKIEAGKIEWHMENVAIQEIMDRAIAGTNALFINKNLPLSQDIVADLPKITGDRNKLIQVMINLLSNAVKFTDEGAIHCRAYEEKGEIIISVTDSGIGIAEADIEKVFEKFKQVGDTLTDKPQGTGLGLPICKEIIEHHGGRIWAESEIGKGSTFYFSLPLIGNKPTNQTIQFETLVKQLKNQIIKSPVPLNGVERTILIVDDDTPIRSLLRQELEEAGYLIDEAENGRAALEAVRKNRPDLILLDVMMPEMNGFDVAAVLKNDPATMDIPIIIISIVQDEKRGFRIGVDRYLTKPIDTEKLFTEVDNLLQQGKSKKKVLVVDEDASAVKTLSDVLQNRGYLVEESNGTALLETAVEARPDIIILNTLLDDNQDLIKTLRFEKGMENVLFFVYQ